MNITENIQQKVLGLCAHSLTVDRKDEFLQKLRDNFEENGDTFAQVAELPEGHRQLDSVIYAHRWGILRGEAYGNEIKTEILRNAI